VKNSNLMRDFLAVLLLSWLIEFLYMGFKGVFEGTLLSLLEISLSFDNAVMNALVLSGMSPLWRRRFLTWGILFAVFGMRFLFPVLIVSITAGINPVNVVNMAITAPEVYSKYLKSAHPVILAFGGSFLFMVFINWLFNAGREIHWIDFLEKKASRIARLGEVKLILALATVLAVSYLKGGHSVTLAMVLGVLLFEVVSFVRSAVELFKGEAGLASFVYLELLDASCSLDGAIGAFAISQNLVIITIGLSVGAVILRTLTLVFVESGKLQKLRYLEHGAHWGIGGLGVMMLMRLFFHIPETAVSAVALVFIVSSLYSSVRRTMVFPG